MAELVTQVTKAVRAADEAFKAIGGSSRHWVRECFLAALEDEGLVIINKKELAIAVEKIVEWFDTHSNATHTGPTKPPMKILDDLTNITMGE